MSKIYFNKIREVKSPTQAYETAAATDFYIPEYSQTFYNDLMSLSFNKEYCSCDISPNADSMNITIAPGGRINIPSGIRVIIEDTNTCLLAVNKSGIATKKALVCGACLVDSDYRGEIHLSLLNVSDRPVTVSTGDKLIQFMHLITPKTIYEEISCDKFNILPSTSRGSNGFGSSGT